jgi:hypothetical protein
LGQEEARAEDLKGQMHEANEQLKVLAQVRTGELKGSTG